MIWTILGIEETKDKNAITKAFRQRLAAVNPEDKPEEFKELREAYEQALRLAEQVEKTDEEKDEIGLWVDKLESLYNDLQQRLDMDAWEKLLSEDVCLGLDTRALAEEAMLRFFMSNFHLPHKVMLYLDEQFGFIEHMDELREKFPPDFLEYIIDNGVKYEDNFPFVLFSPGIDGKAADNYEGAYRKASNSDPNEAEMYYEQLKNSPETHPYGEALLLKVQLANGDTSAADGIKALHEKYPQDNHLAIDLMLAYKNTDQMELMEKIADEILERDPMIAVARRYKAEAVAAQGDYSKAVDLINHLMQDMTGRAGINDLIELRHQWNDAMIDQLKEKTEADPSDLQSRYDLIWCYIQNERFEEADVLAKDFPKEQPDAFGYYNMKSVLDNEFKRNEEALSNLQKLLEAVDNLQPDGNEKTLERIGRRAEVVGRISVTLYELGRTEEALKIAEESLSEDKVDVGSMFNVVSMNLQLEHYERADQLCDKILAREPGNASAFYFKAFANFKLGRDNVAFEYVNDALDNDGSVLIYYLLKLRILVKNNAFDPANELINFLEQNGITDDLTVEYCKLWMFINKEDKDTPKESYDEIIEKAAKADARISANEYGVVDWTSHFYYLYALVTADRQDFDKEYPVEPIIALLDKGLEHDPEYYSCLSYKAWLLKKNKQNDEAMQIYEKLELVPNHNIGVEENIAEIYYSNLEDDAKKALEYYEKLLELNPENPDYCFFAGMCHYRMENPKEAEKYFRLEQQYGPEDIDGYFRLAHTLLKMNRLEEALKQAQKTVEMAQKRKDNTIRFWSPLIKAYRRLGKSDEAIKAAEDCASHNPDWDVKSEIFDILLQAGRFEDAEEHIKKWRKSQKRTDGKGWSTKMTELLMAQEKLRKMAMHMQDWGRVIEWETVKNASLLEYAEKGKFKNYLRVYQDDFKNRSINAHDRGNLAWALYLNGDIEKAREEAALALEDEIEDENRATGFRLMHLARQIRLLAILGCEEEARRKSEEAKSLPICDNCAFSQCSDLAIYNCAMELVFENYEKAMEIAQECRKLMPEQTDFLELEYIIKVKGKKK